MKLKNKKSLTLGVKKKKSQKSGLKSAVSAKKRGQSLLQNANLRKKSKEKCQKFGPEKSDEFQKKLELICALSLHTASLALARDEYVEFAPVGGSCVPFKLFGNSLPVFEYRVFEQKIMEFIKIRVEISKPDTIRFIGTIDCVGVKGQHSDAARHGQEVEVLPKYKEPFEKLAMHLLHYFPFTPNPEGWGRDANRKDIPKKFEVEHGQESQSQASPQNQAS